MHQRLNFITLAVADVERSRTFYIDGLRWEATLYVPGEVLFLPVATGVVLSLWSVDSFRKEVGEPGTGLPPITLAHNVLTDSEVDAVLADARGAGAAVTPAQARDWGGYSGYFSDPDGFRWEVAHNPQTHEDVRLTEEWLAARREAQNPR